MEIDGKEVKVTLNGNKLNLPSSVIIQIRNQFKIQCTGK